MDQSNWYQIDDIDQLDTPVLVVYPERVAANIRTAIEMAGSASRLRPHVKTHKSPEVSKLMIDAGIHKFKCATIAEAEMLAIAGASDVLLAYQPQGPKATRLAALIKKYPHTRFSCLIDNEAAARELDRTFKTEGLQVPVYLDINVGMNRTGIAPGPEALALYKTAAQAEGITPIGLHAYDGHIRDIDWLERKAKCDAAFDQLVNLQQAIVDAMTDTSALDAGERLAVAAPFPAPKIIAGGSPTFSIHCHREGIECSPGTFVYWDKGYLDQCPEQHFLPAALVVTRVISFPAPGRITTDLGHKSIAAENPIDRRVFFLNAEDLKPVGQSEEHLVLETAASSPQPQLTRGTVLYGMPYHVCPTIALYERAITIDEGQITGEWHNSARDRKITI